MFKEFDKLGHIGISCVMALGFGLLLIRMIPRSWLVVGPAAAWMVGFAEELRQRGIPSRDADFDDLLANTVGVLLALSLLQLLAARRDRAKKLYIL